MILGTLHLVPSSHKPTSSRSKLKKSDPNVPGADGPKNLSMTKFGRLFKTRFMGNEMSRPQMLIDKKIESQKIGQGSETGFKGIEMSRPRC